MNTARTLREDLRRLVDEHPLALVISNGDGGLSATRLPLLLEQDDKGTFLLGHFARSNPQLVDFASSPEALIVFDGPDGYVSPSWLRDRTQAPTWNYATGQFYVHVELLREPQAARDALENLMAAMERGRADAWHIAELGSRLEQLLPHVVPFRGRILSSVAKFKLGQDESAEVLQDIMQGAGREGYHDLVRMMREVNRARIPSLKRRPCRTTFEPSKTRR